MLLVAAGTINCATPISALADEIYRWVDAQGRVHFGDKPPAEGAERVEVKPAPTDDPELKRRQERGERLSEIMAEERKARDEEKQEALLAAAERRAKCNSSRARLERAINAAFIYRDTPDPANPLILDESERSEFEQRLRAEIRQYCDPLDSDVPVR
ncbi:MAG: DUF4124 domain-containing protein [Gammaproteobacteria bacterium]|nr:DUF4124 domain-containing protein [Gammaproteobacteria bacterium]